MMKAPAATLFLAVVTPAQAHEATSALAQDWAFGLSVTGSLALALAVYCMGAIRLHRRARFRLWRALAFGGGWLTLAGALTSPCTRWAASSSRRI